MKSRRLGWFKVSGPRYVAGTKDIVPVDYGSGCNHGTYSKWPFLPKSLCRLKTYHKVTVTRTATSGSIFYRSASSRDGRYSDNRTRTVGSSPNSLSVIWPSFVAGRKPNPIRSNDCRQRHRVASCSHSFV